MQSRGLEVFPQESTSALLLEVVVTEQGDGAGKHRAASRSLDAENHSPHSMAYSPGTAQFLCSVTSLIGKGTLRGADDGTGPGEVSHQGSI